MSNLDTQRRAGMEPTRTETGETPVRNATGAGWIVAGVVAVAAIAAAAVVMIDNRHTDTDLNTAQTVGYQQGTAQANADNAAATANNAQASAMTAQQQAAQAAGAADRAANQPPQTQASQPPAPAQAAPAPSNADGDSGQ